MHAGSLQAKLPCSDATSTIKILQPVSMRSIWTDTCNMAVFYLSMDCSQQQRLDRYKHQGSGPILACALWQVPDQHHYSSTSHKTSRIDTVSAEVTAKQSEDSTAQPHAGTSQSATMRHERSESKMLQAAAQPQQHAQHSAAAGPLAVQSVLAPPQIYQQVRYHYSKCALHVLYLKAGFIAAAARQAGSFKPSLSLA